MTEEEKKVAEEKKETPPPPVKKEGEGLPEEKLYAGQYKSVEELEKAVTEKEKMLQKQSAEVGELRNYFEMLTPYGDDIKKMIEEKEHKGKLSQESENKLERIKAENPELAEFLGSEVEDMKSIIGKLSSTLERMRGDKFKTQFNDFDELMPEIQKTLTQLRTGQIENEEAIYKVVKYNKLTENMPRLLEEARQEGIRTVTEKLNKGISPMAGGKPGELPGEKDDETILGELNTEEIEKIRNADTKNKVDKLFE